MSTCSIVKNTYEYQRVQELSGISSKNTEDLDSAILYSLNTVGRYPHLDEIPNANSEPYLRNTHLSIGNNNSIAKDKLFDITAKPTVSESIFTLNDTFRDLEIDAVELPTEVMLDIKKRPSKKFRVIDRKDPVQTNGTMIYEDIVDRLTNIYGVPVNTVTSRDILSNPEFQHLVNVSNAKGFIYNGQIYINTDLATADTYVHELLHMLFGSMKYSNPELYYNTVQLVEKLPNWEYMTTLYPNRTYSDIVEEVFITEMAKYITKQKSLIDSLPIQFRYESLYHIDRMLDSALGGSLSVSLVNDRYTSSISALGFVTGSPVLTTEAGGTIDSAYMHRLVANVKSDLLRKGELIEKCT